MPRLRFFFLFHKWMVLFISIFSLEACFQYWNIALMGFFPYK